MMADGVDKMQSLEALANTDGGKILIKDLENLEESSINRLIQSLDSEATFDSVKGIIAELKTARMMLERIGSRKHLETAMSKLQEEFKKEIV